MWSLLCSLFCELRTTRLIEFGNRNRQAPHVHGTCDALHYVIIIGLKRCCGTVPFPAHRCIFQRVGVIVWLRECVMAWFSANSPLRQVYGSGVLWFCLAHVTCTNNGKVRGKDHMFSHANAFDGVNVRGARANPSSATGSTTTGRVHPEVLELRIRDQSRDHLPQTQRHMIAIILNGYVCCAPLGVSRLWNRHWQWQLFLAHADVHDA